MATKQEQIKDHLRAIAEATRRPYAWGISFEEVAQHTQRHLDEIKRLMQQDKPETLASSVLRLTDLCNRLEAENATLRNDLTDVTLSFSDADSACRKLEEEIARKNNTITLLKERNDRLGVDLDRTEALLLLANRDLAHMDPYLKRTLDTLNRVKRYIETDVK